MQHRELQSFESPRFLSYFPRFLALRGGVASGFHHVESAPAPDVDRLYRVGGSGGSLVVREVPCGATSLEEGADDVFVLDRGARGVWQFNTAASAGKERFRAAEFVRGIVDARKGSCEATVFGAFVPLAGHRATLICSRDCFW